MGGQKSKPESEPEVFKQPWRNIDWNPNNLKSELSELLTFMENHQDIKQFRILLHGPAGAGKSCFINSVMSVYKGRIVFRAAEENSAGKSCTNKYKTYKITDKDSVTLPFVISDVMGLEDEDKDGIHPNDIKNVLHGHVKEGYKFNPVSQLTYDDPGYIDKPSVNDKVYCLVSVLDAMCISLMENKMIQKMKAVRESALELGRSIGHLPKDGWSSRSLNCHKHHQSVVRLSEQLGDDSIFLQRSSSKLHFQERQLL